MIHVVIQNVSVVKIFTIIHNLGIYKKLNQYHVIIAM